MFLFCTNIQEYQQILQLKRINAPLLSKHLIISTNFVIWANKYFFLAQTFKNIDKLCFNFYTANVLHRANYQKTVVLASSMLVLRTNWWRYNGRAINFKHSGNLSAGSWTNCNIYETTHSKVWERFVDNVYSILKRKFFFHRIKNLHQNITFTNGEPMFLDNLLKLNNEKISLVVYRRKPMHTGQYLRYRSHH